MKIITIVCFANYCRSPVAEALLSDRLTSDYEIISAGLEPVVKSGMDERSSKFLDSIGLPKKVHVPKKINTQIPSFRLINPIIQSFCTTLRVYCISNPRV